MTGTSPPTLVCVTCGSELPGSANFCLECGTPVAAAADRETRRTVTLLFTDVTGSTAMGEQLDPEAYRGIMGRYFEVARAAIERHGGTVEKFVGDAVLAVFGVPEIHEDDALRAVRAAHELNAELAELARTLATELDVRLAIRTGINTGTVVTGSARAGGSFATGDAVNTAARLEQAAAPGQILLGAVTYEMVRDAVEADPVDPVPAKGKAEAVPAYRLRGLVDAVHGRRRREDVPLVGRSQEMRALDNALDRTIGSGLNHLVTVLGPPGIGKSRLVGEFLGAVGDRAEVAQGRCVAYGQGITYWPLVQALRQTLRLSGTESDEVTRQALEGALGEASDRDRIVAALLPLLGKTGVAAGTDETLWSVCRLLEALAARRPLVLSIDDLHWAEPTLLDLLERVREEAADLPLLLLCQARPELLEHRPAWGSGSLNSTTFGLDPLGPSDIGASVTALLDGPVPPGLGDTVATWSGGNPLFVEEIVTHLVESGALAREGDGWRLVRTLDRTELPPNVSALLAARLDRLPRAERDLLERLSVIGLEFTSADAELLVDPATRPELGRLLPSLTRRDVVRRLRSPYGDSWAFRHAMVRDAAYDGLAKSLRAELHERLADGLADTAEAGGEQAGLVAHHLEQAARYCREVALRGPTVETLVRRAVEALRRAAAEARDQDQYESCVAFLQRAVDLGSASPAERRRVLVSLSFSHYEQRRFKRLADTLAALEAEQDETADELDHAFLRTLLDASAVLTSDDDPSRVMPVAQELTSLGRRLGDNEAVLTGLRVQSDCSMAASLWDDAMENCDEIIRIGSAADTRAAWKARGAALMFGEATLREVSEYMSELGGPTARQEFRHIMMGALLAAADASREAREIVSAGCARIRELHSAGKIGEATLPIMIDAHAMTRDLDAAIAYAVEVNDELRATGDTGFASTSVLRQALLQLERGDAAAAIVPLVEEGSRYTSPYDVVSIAYGTGCRSLLALRERDDAAASALAGEALRVVDRTQHLWLGADLRRCLAEVPRATGDADLERRLLLDAMARYARKGIRSYDTEINARLAELDRG